MVTSPDLIVFDVNETLSDMAPLGEAFAQEGAPAGLAATWFAGILRDGFAVTAAGGNAAFAEIAQDSLHRLLSAHGVTAPGESVERIMGTLKSLNVHPDVVPGVEALRQVAELVTLTNGATQVAESLLSSAGVREHFSELLSVEDAPAWKPARSSYDYAVTHRGTDPQKMLLIAVHPWDIHGAHQAGLRTAWINRTGARYPVYFARPDLEAADLPALAAQLTAVGG
ncbi:haloacid dehalogenase, type II [Kocuria sp. CNJ-770]|jgi:2-haloacid dehalogenase|uniref:haloacid dehalogenase type II n=1 Tax=Kocuria sp. CNJ-770 TaxID=1904964 RepID=UPI00095D3451|nr:haloacid dehalogenase type II [Kocuria sp. CNJ-770]OLT06344.1 haloacid dehalogenase, type II [Kocuria sp. CNJ-770]